MRGIALALLLFLGPTCQKGEAATWISFVDRFSSARHRSVDGERLDYVLRAGVPHPYAGLLMSMPRTDATTFEGVRFRARGEGRFSCLVPTLATKAASNHFGSPFAVTRAWSTIELPFAELVQSWGKPARWDPMSVIGVQFNVQGKPGDAGWLCVQGVELYSAADRRTPRPEVNPVVLEPKVNQVGYLPEAEKYFVLTASDRVRGGDPFVVRDARGRVRHRGRIPAVPIDDARSTGERVFAGSFTELAAPGRYVIAVNGLESVPFSVRSGLYASVFREVLRCFRHVRCGVAGAWYGACHRKDAPVAGESAKPLDLTGGWHNAGDCGKWTHMAAITCAHMMWLHELRGHRPGLLREARHGLSWLLKMQRPDGSVLHKVDHEGSPHFGADAPPDVDPVPYDRFARGAGTIDAANFVGVMCQAARVYRASQPAFAARALAAARRAWAWLEAHPHLVQRDPFYRDDDPAPEKLWALGEMARTANDARLRTRFAAESAAVPLRAVSWMSPQFFGYAAQLFDPRALARRSVIEKALVSLSDEWTRAADENAYGVTLRATDYNWGSSSPLLNRACALLFAHHLTARPAYRRAALRQLNYLFGTNALNLSFVTGRGARAVSRPHHWSYTAYGRTMPGWASGGPNGNPDGVDPLLARIIRRGTPPAKCFYDGPLGTSYASNEGQISEQAALLFAIGYLAGD